MAVAKFYDGEVNEDGDTMYEAMIEDYSRYTGPPGTSWHVIDSSSYQFRTSADEVAEIVEAVRAGTLTIKAACKTSPTFQQIVDEQLAAEEEDAEADGPSLSTTERRKQWCNDADIASLFISLMDDNPYWVAEDKFNPQAVEILDYPEWASAETGDGGGMGSGYTAGYICVKKGHDLDELWRWLEKRQAELQTTKPKPKKSRRKAQ